MAIYMAHPALLPIVSSILGSTAVSSSLSFPPRLILPPALDNVTQLTQHAANIANGKACVWEAGPVNASLAGCSSGTVGSSSRGAFTRGSVVLGLGLGASAWSGRGEGGPPLPALSQLLGSTGCPAGIKPSSSSKSSSSGGGSGGEGSSGEGPEGSASGPASAAASLPDGAAAAMLFNMQQEASAANHAWLLLLYHTELLAAAGWSQPPDTWDSLLQLASMAPTDLNGDGLPEYGLCADLGPGCKGPALATAALASMAQGMGTRQVCVRWEGGCLSLGATCMAQSEVAMLLGCHDWLACPLHDHGLGCVCRAHVLLTLASPPCTPFHTHACRVPSLMRRPSHPCGHPRQQPAQSAWGLGTACQAPQP